MALVAPITMAAIPLSAAPSRVAACGGPVVPGESPGSQQNQEQERGKLLARGRTFRCERQDAAVAG